MATREEELLKQQNLMSRRAGSPVQTPAQAAAQPLTNKLAVAMPSAREVGQTLGSTLPKVEAGVQAAGRFLGRGAQQIAGMPGAAISNSILRPGYDATKGFLEGAGIIQPPRPVQTTPLASPVGFQFPQGGASAQPPSLLRTPDMKDPVPAAVAPAVNTNPYNLPEYTDVGRVSRIEFGGQPAPSRGSFNVISSQEMQRTVPASRVLEMDPNLAPGAFDFGRAERDRLNSIYASKLDAGLSPAEAKDQAEIENMIRRSPGGAAVARMLLQSRKAAGEQKQSERESLAKVGYTQAQINQIEQSLPVDLAKRRAEMQSILGQEARAQERQPYELEGLDYGNEKSMAEAAKTNWQARLLSTGKFTPAMNAIASTTATAAPEAYKTLETVFGDVVANQGEMGSDPVTYTLPGVNRNLNQAEMAQLMAFIDADMRASGNQAKPGTFYLEQLGLL